MKETITNTFKLKGDRVIWLLIMIFAMISLAVVYSSTSALAYRLNSSPFSYMLRQLFFYVVGFGILLICYRIPLKFYRQFSYILLIITAILLIIPSALGNLRSFSIFGISVHPSEIAKITIVLYLAKIIETSKLDTFKEYTLKVLLPIAGICALCILGSVSATLIICCISFIILACSGIKKQFLLWTVLIAIGAGLMLFGIHAITKKITRLDTFTARIERFFTNEEEIMSVEELQKHEEYSFQAEQAKEAIQLGGIFGRGPGNSIKRNVLPNAYDDYIYSIIVEEYGLVGGLAVIILYLWFYYRCLIIARACTKKFSTITVLGLSTLIIMQAFLHIFVNTGIFPVTGQTLPMISRGGTSLIIMSSAFGIILSVNRTIVITADKEKTAVALNSKNNNDNEEDLQDNH